MIHRWRARSAVEAANRAIASRLNTDRLDLSLAVMFSKSLSKDPLLQMEEDDDDERVMASYFILETLMPLMIAILRCAVIVAACISAGFGLDRVAAWSTPLSQPPSLASGASAIFGVSKSFPRVFGRGSFISDPRPRKELVHFFAQNSWP